MSIEAMQLALEALDGLSEPYDVLKAQHALRIAIEAAEKQEPRCAVIVEVFAKDWRLDYMSLPVGKHRLYTQEYVYTTPPAAQPCPTCEALARTVMMDQTAHDTTPPAAQRQPLTDEEIDDIWNRYCDEMGEASINDAYDIARAIEAKLKEKNT